MTHKEIIERRKAGARLEELAERSNLSRSKVGEIVRGITIQKRNPPRTPYLASYERRCKQWDAGKAIV